MSDEQLALRAGCPSSKVARLLQKLADVGLLEQAAGCWHAPLVARVAQLHDGGARRVREHRKRARGEWVLRNTGCNAPSNAVSIDDPPPPSPLPLTLSLSSTPTTAPIAAQSSDGAFFLGEGDRHEPTKTAARRRKISSKTLTADQQATRIAFVEWWSRIAYPAAMHGVVYEFEGSRDAAAVLKILRSTWVNWNIERAQDLAGVFLAAEDRYLDNQGRPIFVLAQQLRRWIHEAEIRQKGIFNGGRSAVTARGGRDAAGVRPGEFPEQPGTLARLARRGRAAS